jgi:ElaB/YqjD/DUF883 family membrane-anchored ribosome-binding protein
MIQQERQTMTRIDETEFDAGAEIAALREKVEALMNQRVAPAVAAVAGEAEAAARAAADRVRAETDGVRGQVQDNPLLAIGIAAAAGFVLAHLLRR